MVTLFHSRMKAEDAAYLASKREQCWYRVLADEDGYLVFKGKGKPELERPLVLFHNGVEQPR